MSKQGQRYQIVWLKVKNGQLANPEAFQEAESSIQEIEKHITQNKLVEYPSDILKFFLDQKVKLYGYSQQSEEFKQKEENKVATEFTRDLFTFQGNQQIRGLALLYVENQDIKINDIISLSYLFKDLYLIYKSYPERTDILHYLYNARKSFHFYKQMDASQLSLNNQGKIKQLEDDNEYKNYLVNPQIIEINHSTLLKSNGFLQKKPQKITDNELQDIIFKAEQNEKDADLQNTSQQDGNKVFY
ncbi:hypothetical protein PPERSA_09637 [Pseudocohnilembus persalinus]|uniref:Uncharacterized protein n=1 Tax=Pseudocohnilembus persalinus TaxID=266149 RepID=A0A0V0QFS8_PSEPJ|nr:hypothetical protein PPERSA_09637 [Pseudocohnilembus persalinus]|eukprot:KRX01031.1 hypothetical protein PPERSA_09637 [Pseudocohnilembus persalinus]